MNDTAFAASLVGCTFEGPRGLRGPLFTVLSADGPLVQVVSRRRSGRATTRPLSRTAPCGTGGGTSTRRRASPS